MMKREELEKKLYEEGYHNAMIMTVVNLADIIWRYTFDLRRENEEKQNIINWYKDVDTIQRMRIEELEKGINDTINNHRKKVMLTCEEGCWCWGLSKLTGGE